LLRRFTDGRGKDALEMKRGKPGMTRERGERNVFVEVSGCVRERRLHLPESRRHAPDLCCARRHGAAVYRRLRRLS